jgi:hypothetical protein
MSIAFLLRLKSVKAIPATNPKMLPNPMDAK